MAPPRTTVICLKWLLMDRQSGPSKTKTAEQSEFKEGSFVIVLGTVDDKGILHASHIDLRLPR